MTDIRVREIITDQITAAIAALKKARCPHCGKAIADKAAKVAKAGADDFFDRLVNGGAPLQSASGGLFDVGPSSPKLVKKTGQSPSGGLF
jgi:hypothetical protein